MKLAWIITHLNSTGDEIINVCLPFPSSWLCAANKRPKAYSEPNATHTANKHAPELSPNEVIFTAIVRKWLSVVVISQAWDQQGWPLKPHCEPFQHWWLFPIKQNWGKRGEINRRLGGLEPIYLALLFSSAVITGESIWGIVSWFHIWLPDCNFQVESSEHGHSSLKTYRMRGWSMDDMLKHAFCYAKTAMCLFSIQQVKEIKARVQNLHWAPSGDSYLHKQQLTFTSSLLCPTFASIMNHSQQTMKHQTSFWDLFRLFKIQKPGQQASFPSGVLEWMNRKKQIEPSINNYTQPTLKPNGPPDFIEYYNPVFYLVIPSWENFRNCLPFHGFGSSGSINTLVS